MVFVGLAQGGFTSRAASRSGTVGHGIITQANCPNGGIWVKIWAEGTRPNRIFKYEIRFYPQASGYTLSSKVRTRWQNVNGRYQEVPEGPADENFTVIGQGTITDTHELQQLGIHPGQRVMDMFNAVDE